MKLSNHNRVGGAGTSPAKEKYAMSIHGGIKNEIACTQFHIAAMKNIVL